MAYPMGTLFNCCLVYYMSSLINILLTIQNLCVRGEGAYKATHN